MCDSLGIEPKPNNGTLRLPLKPIGLHSDKQAAIESDLPDFPSESPQLEHSPTEANEPNITDFPIETNLQVTGATTSGIKPVVPVETDVPIVTTPPEGMLHLKQVDVAFQLIARRGKRVRRD